VLASLDSAASVDLGGLGGSAFDQWLALPTDSVAGIGTATGAVASASAASDAVAGASNAAEGAAASSDSAAGFDATFLQAIHTDEQNWINSPLGESIDNTINKDFGEYLIGNGANGVGGGTLAEATGGNGGALFGDGGSGATDAAGQGGDGGAGGLVGDGGEEQFVPLTIRDDASMASYVLQNSVTTWQAYNLWGGYNLYNGPGGAADYNNRALAVSLDRPYDLDGASAFLVHERAAIQLAERLGMPLAYVSSMDIAADPHLLDGASALFSLGHDEYWSPPERANVTAARNAGTNLAFLGANCCFRRTRLAGTGLGPDRLVICYKTSYTEDPMYGKDNKLVTSDWREPPHPDPESSLIGTLYEGYPANADYVVASPKAWPFAGTGVDKGTRFPGLVGVEYDRVNPGSPVERPIEILSHSPLTCRGVNSYGDSAYYTHSSGAGVFNTGTMFWVASFGGWYKYGLNRHAGHFTRKVTANVLRAFADGPAAAKYPAHDNLDAMDEWAGDPIASQHNLWPPIHLLTQRRAAGREPGTISLCGRASRRSSRCSTTGSGAPGGTGGWSACTPGAAGPRGLLTSRPGVTSSSATSRTTGSFAGTRPPTPSASSASRPATPTATRWTARAAWSAASRARAG